MVILNNIEILINEGWSLLLFQTNDNDLYKHNFKSLCKLTPPNEQLN